MHKIECFSFFYRFYKIYQLQIMSTYEQISHTQDATSRGPSLDINDLNTNNNVPTTPTNEKGYSKVSILQPRKKTKRDL